jgi:glycosyltransferase involved in cell wall biosynthesis
MPVSASVIVCTYNRADILARCIDAVGREVVTVGDCNEIIVVDSGSTDATPSVVEALRTRWPMLRYERAPGPGLSLARNRAIEVARGGVLVFLDDDAEPGEGWLDAVLRAYADPEVAAVGGRSWLAWPGPPPRWLTTDLSTLFSAFDLGDEGRMLGPGEHPFGVNMSVRREWAEAVGGFATVLGRRGESLLSNEELAFFARLDELGGRTWYEPDAVVVHHVPAERASLSWLIRRAWAQGRSDVRAGRLASSCLAHLRLRLLVPRGNIRRWARLASAVRAGDGARGRLADEVVTLVELAGAVGEWATGDWGQRIEQRRPTRGRPRDDQPRRER